MEAILVAPCGANCNVCSSYLAMKNDVKKSGVVTRYCRGCGPRGKGCGFTKLGCGLLINQRVRFCFECEEFPCYRNKETDERYRNRFHVSLLENLYFMKENGVEKFLEREEKRWKCPECGGVISYHNGICYNCGVEKLKKNKGVMIGGKEKMEPTLLAPCGINCNICPSHLREKKKCPGCHNFKPGATRCVVINCDELKASLSGYCYECEKFPCRRIRQIDERYRANRGISNIENLALIKEKSVAYLLQREEPKWKCPECGWVIGHNGICYHCGHGKPKKMVSRKFVGEVTDEVLIAPCGMNCGVCSAYLAMKCDVRSQGLRTGYCAGCRPRDKWCALIKLYCINMVKGKVQYCNECAEFPCKRLQGLDKRYRERFHMSMIENLTYIKEQGMQKFLEKEKGKWRCPECGGVISCHNGICYSCGVEKLKNRKKPYRWEDD